MKKLICTFLAALLMSVPAHAIETISDDAIDIKAPSAILMEKTSGEVIYEKNAHEKRPPASVTKVMTLLLIVEAIERGDISLDDTVIASRACRLLRRKLRLPRRGREDERRRNAKVHHRSFR